MNNNEEFKILYNMNPDQFRLFTGEGPHRGPYKDTTDNFGNTLWHYWVNSQSPKNVYKKWESRLKKVDINKPNNNNETVFHKCIVKNDIELFDFLKSNYEEPKLFGITREGENILHYAAWANNIDFLKESISTSLYDINLQNTDGITPLIIAIHKNNIEMITTLLLAGADPNLQDIKGKNVMHHAADNGNIDIYELLEDAGGDIEQPDILKRLPPVMLEKFVYKTEEEIIHAKNFWVNQYNNRCKIWN